MKLLWCGGRAVKEIRRLTRVPVFRISDVLQRKLLITYTNKNTKFKFAGSCLNLICGVFSVSYFQPNSGGITCVEEMNAALCLFPRARKLKYKYLKYYIFI